MYISFFCVAKSGVGVQCGCGFFYLKNLRAGVTGARRRRDSSPDAAVCHPQPPTVLTDPPRSHSLLFFRTQKGGGRWGRGQL